MSIHSIGLSVAESSLEPELAMLQDEHSNITIIQQICLQVHSFKFNSLVLNKTRHSKN